MKINLRPANPTDSPALVSLLKKFLGELDDMVHCAVDEEMALDYVRSCIDNGLVMVMTKGVNGSAKMVGSLSVIPAEYQWSKDWFLNEEWFYVLPDYRGTSAPIKMIEAAERFADELGKTLHFGLYTKEPDSLQRVLTRRKYVHGGGIFMRKPNHVRKEQAG